MKRSYSTPEMEVEKFDRYFVLTASSGGGGTIDHGGEEVGDDEVGSNGLYANDTIGTY